MTSVSRRGVRAAALAFALVLTTALGASALRAQTANAQTSAAPAAPAAPRDSVLATVDAFFRAMSAHDTAASRATLMTDGQFYAVQQQADSARWHRSASADYIAFVGGSTEALRERVWEPTVLVHGAVAVVWAPYDFHRGGRFSHCGVDAFTLVRTGQGWKIAGIVYTVEPQGCAPSPLGPLPPR